MDPSAREVTAGKAVQPAWSPAQVPPALAMQLDQLRSQPQLTAKPLLELKRI